MLLTRGNLLALALPLGTTFGTIPLAILFTCVYNSTGGSLPLPILFHAVVNSVYSLLALTWPEVPFTYRYMEFAVAYSLAATMMVLVFGSARLSRGPLPGKPVAGTPQPESRLGSG